MLPAVSRKILEYLEKIDERSGKARKMDFLRIAGNEAMANDWIQYLLTCNLIAARQDNGIQIYCKTDSGQKVHDVLKLDPFLGSLFEDISRMRRQKNVFYIDQ